MNSNDIDKLNELLMSEDYDNNNNNRGNKKTNFNYNNKINFINNSNFYNNNKDQFIKAEASQANEISFFTRNNAVSNKGDHYIMQYNNTENNQNSNDSEAINGIGFPQGNKQQNNYNHTDVNIKNKILNLNNSLKTFKIQIKNRIINYSDYESSRNKNSFINHLLDYITDMIWLFKDEKLLNGEFIEKINSYQNKAEESEKKIKKLNAELEETKKYLSTALLKNELNSTSKAFNKKAGLSSLNSTNNEGNDIIMLKAENKKLASQVTILKTDIKKRELEYNKLQEKLKKLLNDKTGLGYGHGHGHSHSLSLSVERANTSASQSNNNNNLNHSGYSINTFNPVINKSCTNNVININNNNKNTSHLNRSNISNSNTKNNINNDFFKLSSLLSTNNDLNLKIENPNLLSSLNNNPSQIPNGKNNSNTKKSISNSQRSNCNKSINNLHVDNIGKNNENQIKILYKKFLEYQIDSNLNKKYNTLINQNNCLMNILFKFQESLNNINNKIGNFNKNNTKVKFEVSELTRLKQSVFSLHLIENELLSEFSDNFLDNIKILEDVILRIMEILFFENSEIKDKYFKLEKEYIKFKAKNHNFVSYTVDNDTYLNNKDTSNNLNSSCNNDAEACSVNGPGCNLNAFGKRSSSHNKASNKDKDLIKNLKRWSANRVSINSTPASGVKNQEKSSINSRCFVPKLENTSNNYDQKMNANESYYIHNSSYNVNK